MVEEFKYRVAKDCLAKSIAAVTEHQSLVTLR